MSGGAAPAGMYPFHSLVPVIYSSYIHPHKDIFTHVIVSAWYPHRHASMLRASAEIAPGLSGLSILNNSLAGPRKYTARLAVCGSTFLKGPSRILGAGTVSCLRVYLTHPGSGRQRRRRQVRSIVDSPWLHPYVSELKMHHGRNFVMTRRELLRSSRAPTRDENETFGTRILRMPLHFALSPRNATQTTTWMVIIPEACLNWRLH